MDTSSSIVSHEPQKSASIIVYHEPQTSSSIIVYHEPQTSSSSIVYHEPQTGSSSSIVSDEPQTNSSTSIVSDEPQTRSFFAEFCRLFRTICTFVCCLTCCGVCGILYICCPPFSKNITSKLAFYPQSPGYEFKRDLSKAGKFNLKLSRKVNRGNLDFILRHDVFFLHSADKRKVAVIFMKCTEEKKFTILFSHGNSGDLGYNHQFLIQMSHITGCDIVSYDYPGFGESTGSASENKINSDIEMVFKYILDTYEPSPEKIILYGESFGTVPTVHLATKVTCAGVVLHSALSSSCRVLCPKVKNNSGCVDTLNNLKKIPKVTAPVLIIHGTLDNVVGISQAEELLDSCRNPVEPLWIVGAGHDNLRDYELYEDRLQKFVDEDLAA